MNNYLNQLQKTYQNDDDFTTRQVDCGMPLTLCFLDSMCSDIKISNYVVEPLTYGEKATDFECIKKRLTTGAIVKEPANFFDVLDMTVEEAVDFFQNITSIKNKIQTLYDVGLGYIKLGQPATTLSGGEAQRVKLATELSKRSTGRTIYILDEPTTGLHAADVHKLIEVLQQLVDAGNTVLVIEHNLDVIKTADYIIDLGPEGGDGGGRVVASGTPEEVAQATQVGYIYLCYMSVCLPILYILHVTRSAVQGMGNTVLPMVSGIAEFVMRTGGVLLLPMVMGENGIFLAEVLAWAGADVILIPSYFITLKKHLKH